MAPMSKMPPGYVKAKLAIANLLKAEGYVQDVAVRDLGPKREIEIALKYYLGKPAIDRLDRVSRPGLRRYRGKNDLPRVLGGLGMTIVSTSRGLMSGKRARRENIGGEILAQVY